MTLRNQIAKKVKQIQYQGKKHFCPICQFKARTFLSAGLYTKRPNSKCPKCYSLVRHRLLWLYLTEKIKISSLENPKVLHFAPEGCLQKALKKCESLNYYSSDYGSNSISDFNFDLEKINYQYSDFDLIICSHVLEHVNSDLQAIRELYRILKPQGRVLLQVPIWPSEMHPTYENPAIIDPRDRMIHFGQHDHVRIYGLDIVERLKTVGFEVKVVNFEKQYSSDKIEKYRLHNTANIRELIFDCKK